MWKQYIQTETYDKGTRPKIELRREFEAYAASIELLNVILHGSLKKEPKALRPEDVAHILSAPNERLSEISLFLRLAEKYYPDGVSQERYPPEFVDAVISKYTKFDADLCIERDGRLIKIR